MSNTEAQILQLFNAQPQNGTNPARLIAAHYNKLATIFIFWSQQKKCTTSCTFWYEIPVFPSNTIFPNHALLHGLFYFKPKRKECGDVKTLKPVDKLNPNDNTEKE